jgi:hypothetical protein
MTETDWLTCKDPYYLLEYLNERASDRQLRLIACSIIRHAPFASDGRTIWDLLPEFTYFGSPTLNCQTVVESAERFADGLETSQSWARARKYIGGLIWEAEGDTFFDDIEGREGDSNFFMAMALAVQNTIRDLGERSADHLRWRIHHILVYLRFARRNQGLKLHSKHERRVSDLIREIIGNPFRPVSLDLDRLASDGGEVSSLARSLYEKQDFSGMPILGSAFEKLGCEDPDILAHCRSTTGHARGCWVVDALIGRS